MSIQVYIFLKKNYISSIIYPKCLASEVFCIGEFFEFSNTCVYVRWYPNLNAEFTHVP